MSFETELIDLIGTATDSHDIKAVVRRCFFYDFVGQPVRLWQGQGLLVTEDGNEWLGTVDGNGTDHHIAPAVKDSRDGASPRYDFSIPYLDNATYLAMKADQEIALDRDLICYHAIFANGEGLRPATPIRFNYRLSMRGVQFSESTEESGGDVVVNRSAAVFARSLEFGRSKIPHGTYTGTSQAERARLLGVASDSGCDFVASNARRTITIG